MSPKENNDNIKESTEICYESLTNNNCRKVLTKALSNILTTKIGSKHLLDKNYNTINFTVTYYDEDYPNTYGEEDGGLDKKNIISNKVLDILESACKKKYRFDLVKKYRFDSDINVVSPYILVYRILNNQDIQNYFTEDLSTIITAMSKFWKVFNNAYDNNNVMIANSKYGKILACDVYPFRFHANMTVHPDNLTDEMRQIIIEHFKPKFEKIGVEETDGLIYQRTIFDFEVAKDSKTPYMAIYIA